MANLINMSPVAVLTAGLTVLWCLWKVFQGYVLKSPLDNIPGPGRTSFWTGNIQDIFDRHAWDFHTRLAEKYGSGVVKFHSFLGSRGLYVFDPKALNNIIVKEQSIYEEPEWVLATNQLVFGTSLISVHGEHHRRQRKLLNPVFHINHMRHMTPIFYRTVHRLREAVSTQIGTSASDVNVLEWMGRTALELVGQGGLGYSFDSLTENKSNPYGDALKNLVPTIQRLLIWRAMVQYAVAYIPLSIRTLLAPYLPIPYWRNMLDIVDAMDAQSSSILQSKKKALEKGDEEVVHQIGEGKDVMSILMKANMKASGEDKLPDEELLGQMSFLVFAATDTTSNALSRTLHILAERQDVQDKLRAEIVGASPDGDDIPYDTLVALPYLDAICRETLRLYPPASTIQRETREDTVMPLSDPIIGNDGQIISEIPVPKGTSVIIAIQACNRNKALWGDDALEWKPERWLDTLPDALGKAHVPGIYANLMTFNGGGRACIGFKFSQLEMKTVLAVMLRSFRFSLSDKEIYWNIAGVNYPTVGKTNEKPAAFLRLERINA